MSRQGGNGQKPVVLVTSPHAGNAIAASALIAQLREHGLRVVERVSVRELDHTRPHGAAWQAAGAEAVIAAGGDGTVGSVATQLLGSTLPMGILPMGTANDVARSLYLPLDLTEACAAIARGGPVVVDAGQAVPALTEPGAYSVESEHAEMAIAHVPSPMQGAYFLHALTLGLNVEFARFATDVAWRRRWGSLTYATSALGAVTRFRPVEARLRFFGLHGTDTKGDMTVDCRAVQITAVNTPVFGGAVNFRLPDVVTHDRLLDFVILEALDLTLLRATVESALAALARLTEGGRPPASDEVIGLALPGIRRYKARAAIIEAAEHVDITLDGEIRTHTPALVRVAPEPVRILLPPEAADALATENGGQEPGAASR